MHSTVLHYTRFLWNVNWYYARTPCNQLYLFFNAADDKNNNAIDFVHKFENCTEVIPSTGDITTIENGTCYYLKSHNKFFITEYQPRRMKRSWQVQISPDCKLLRIQFHDLFGIAGNPYMNCEGN